LKIMQFFLNKMSEVIVLIRSVFKWFLNLSVVFVPHD